MSDETPAPAPVPSPLAADFASFLAALRAFRRDFLVQGQDYGVIPGTGSRAKPTLLKPGAEKLAAWLRLRPTFESDHGTWVQAGSLPGLFCYICRLVDPDGQVAGEGRGSAHCEEGREKYGAEKRERGEDRPWAPNVAVKFAEKRAMIDAILRVGCISDLFTQDTEDMEAQAAAAYAAQQARQATQAKRPPAGAPAAVPGAATPSVPPAASPASSASAEDGGFDDLEPALIRPGQLRQITALLPQAGIGATRLCEKLGVITLETLPATRAEKTITWLQEQVKKRQGGQAA